MSAATAADRRGYALAAINVMEVSGNVTIAGFAGGNVGTIRDSYCATAMTSAGCGYLWLCPRERQPE